MPRIAPRTREEIGLLSEEIRQTVVAAIDNDRLADIRLELPVAGLLAEGAFFAYVFTLGRWAHHRGETGDLAEAERGFDVPVAG